MSNARRRIATKGYRALAGFPSLGSRGVPPFPSVADVHAAAVRLETAIRKTPIMAVHGDELGVPARVYLKLELMQHTGSFKARGALNALFTRDVPPAGVVAASGGNHGAAVAWAAAQIGVPATVFVPATSPSIKAERIASYGADVRIVDGYYPDAAKAATEFAAARNVTSVHAYDEPAVVAGQGTVGLEIRDQVPNATAVLVTVGGGGLVAGITIAGTGGPAVIPVEPTRCPTLHAALAAGRPVPVEVGGVAADSTGAGVAGSIAYDVVSSGGQQVRQVEDEAIVTAQRWLWEQLRVVAEPGGAVALAGLMSGAYVPHPGDTVVVLVCGGNAAWPP